SSICYPSIFRSLERRVSRRRASQAGTTRGNSPWNCQCPDFGQVEETRYATGARRSSRLVAPPAVHRVERSDGLHHVERLPAVVERGRPGLRPEVDLVIPVRLVPDGLVAHERAVDAGRAAVHESRAHVAAGDEDRALPVHGAVILQISVLDDENAGTLDLAVDGEAGEVRAGVELASEVHELRVAWRSQVERLT